MYPSAIVNRALDKGLQIIAVCDHNCAGNVEAVSEAGKRVGLTVLGGMEICSEEEVHLLVLFDDLADLKKMEETIIRHRPGTNEPEIWGEQVLFDDRDRIMGIEEAFLAGACTMSMEEVVLTARGFNGLVIASHVNREAYGLLGVLGYIPPWMPFGALEVAAVGFPGWEDLYDSSLPKVRFSDAHYLDQIGLDYTAFILEEPTVKEISKALEGVGGRKVVY